MIRVVLVDCIVNEPFDNLINSIKVSIAATASDLLGSVLRVLLKCSTTSGKITELHVLFFGNCD